tara:strand:- start:860 stop:988 length:129 start_codon:yes stop_codon:yes gene_type:complete
MTSNHIHQMNLLLLGRYISVNSSILGHSSLSKTTGKSGEVKN